MASHTHSDVSMTQVIHNGPDKAALTGLTKRANFSKFLPIFPPDSLIISQINRSNAVRNVSDTE